MDFDIKHLIFAGLDVHKKTVIAAVCTTYPVTLEATYTVKYLFHQQFADRSYA